ncbi:MAG: hypothetical protein KKC68_09300 [Candidatus Thermoplasmatota archaeon]|nr:hypothetical protein [Candidatus Thermoplasmatota archaeon]
MLLPKKFVDYVLYLSLFILAIWVIGKLFGIIQSPAWVEVIPYAAGLMGAGAFLEMFRRMVKDLREVSQKVSDIDSRVIRMEAKTEGYELREIEGLKEKFAEAK